jgi:hypothetical protein
VTGAGDRLQLGCCGRRGAAAASGGRIPSEYSSISAEPHRRSVRVLLLMGSLCRVELPYSFERLKILFLFTQFLSWHHFF